MAKKTFWRIYGIVLSVALAVAGICLMVACYGIYASGGEQIYTTQKIAAAFAPISIPVFLALALTLGGFILHLFMPLEEKKTVNKNYALMLRKLHEKNDLSRCGDRALVAAIEKQPRLRKLHSIISLVVLGLCTVAFLIHACNGSNFHSSEITQSMIVSMYIMLPCLAIPFGYGVFTAYFCKASIQKELALMKLVACPRTPAPAPAKKESKAVLFFQLGVLVAAVALIVVGVLGDGFADVLTKAVNICRECVGLG